MPCKEWIPERIINGEGSNALIVLNQPFNEENTVYLRQNWNSAVVRVAVDGGANYVRKLLESDMKMPDFISGDFDSITSENLEYFKGKGVNIIPTPDQDHTDFTKGLKLTLEFVNEHNLEVSSIIAVARTEDRLDQLFGNFNTLYYALEYTNIPVFLLGNKCLTWLLTKGSHKIRVPGTMKSSHVGLIPLGKECTDITTTGLKWNLTHDNMKFGGLISTSNTWDDNASEVFISTDTELIFTMEIKNDC